MTDLGWSKSLLAGSIIPVLGLLSVGILGGNAIYKQNRATQEALRVSQSRADAASKAQSAILVMGKAEAQLVGASELSPQRDAAVLVIRSASTLDESIQRLQQTLVGSSQVAELSRLLMDVGPTKLAIIRSVRSNDHAAAKDLLESMQPAMLRIEQISGELVQEENQRLLAAVVRQGIQARSTLRVLGCLVACCLVLSLIAGWTLKNQTRELARARCESDMFINCVPAILIGTDDEGRITRWNATAAEVFGLLPADVNGKPLHQCGISWRKIDFKQEVSGWRNIDKSHRYDEITFDRAGEVRCLGLTINPVRVPGRRMLEFLITGADITERRAMEEELRQAQKLEAIGRLSAGVAHEINTPVQYVSDNVTFVKQSWISTGELLSQAQRISKPQLHGQTIEQALADFDARCEQTDLGYLQNEVPQAIDQSLEGLNRISEIVLALKEFSHPGTTEKQAVDLNRAIASTITVARSEWKYVAEVATDFDDTLPLVPCYASEFNQVILNLLINASHAVADAVKDNPNGKGVITLRTTHDDHWAEVQIADTGCGIPEEVGNKVFEPFFTTKPMGQGTGQGLALARSVIVKKHGGKIWFKSTPGEGTTFYLRLPLSLREKSD